MMFLVHGAPPPPSRDAQLPSDMLFITMFYTYLVTEDVYHRGGGQHRVRQSVKICIIL